MSRCHRANKYNHLAICLACIEFNDRVYAIEHQYKKVLQISLQKMQVFKEKYGEERCTSYYT